MFTGRVSRLRSLRSKGYYGARSPSVRQMVNSGLSGYISGPAVSGFGSWPASGLRGCCSNAPTRLLEALRPVPGG